MFFYLIIPAGLAVVALMTGNIFAKLGVPLSCAAVLLWFLRDKVRDISWVIIALCFSAAGDWFLSMRAGRVSFFLAGVILFFCAHIGYLGFALRYGRPNWRVFSGFLAVYLPFYKCWLHPAIHNSGLSIAVLLYLLISCLVFAAACGMQAPARAKWAYVAAMGLIVFSDTIIAFTDFLDMHVLSRLILPTYYLAHLCVGWAVLTIWHKKNSTINC